MLFWTSSCGRYLASRSSSTWVQYLEVCFPWECMVCMTAPSVSIWCSWLLLLIIHDIHYCHANACYAKIPPMKVHDTLAFFTGGCMLWSNSSHVCTWYSRLLPTWVLDILDCLPWGHIICRTDSHVLTTNPALLMLLNDTEDVLPYRHMISRTVSQVGT